jgi:hypothetical protein
MWRHTLGILGTVLLAAACTSMPSARAVAVNGVVLAPDDATAREAASLLDEMTARLDALDAGLEIRPLHVWLLDEVGDGDVYGGYDRPNHRILLDVHRKHPAATLAHELVHAYEPERWSRLPAVVREGLADHLAALAVPEIAVDMRAARAISLASYATGGLPVPVTTAEGRVIMTSGGVPVETELTPVEALEIPHGRIRAAGDGQVLKALYGMGLLIVRRAGIAKLEELASATAGGLVPPDVILAAARLDDDPATWGPAIEGLLEGPDERRRVREMLGLGAPPPSEPAHDELSSPPSDMRD